MAKKQVILNFPRELLKEPIICNLGQQFNVIVNIHLAEITEDRGWLKVELEGEAEQIEEGLAWVMSRGIRVEPFAEA
jgi:ABC-type methionine transport system ATPase subunit